MGGVLGQWVTGVRAFSPSTEATSKAGDRRAIGIVPHWLRNQAGGASGAAFARGRGARFVLARGPESADNIVSRVSRPCAARRRGAWFWRRVPLRCARAAEAWVEARAGGGGLCPLNLSTPQAGPVAGAGLALWEWLRSY